MRRTCEATVTIDAPQQAVWNVVSDVTRVGEWSGECRRCDWVGRSEPLPTARFRGRNRRGWARWTRLNEIDVANPPNELVWHTVVGPLYRDSTEWRISVRPSPDGGDGAEVSLSFRVLSLSRPMERFLDLVQPAHRDRAGDLREDLARLKTMIETAGVGS